MVWHLRQVCHACWQDALVPAGVTPLLLNKFLGLARRRTGAC